MISGFVSISSSNRKIKAFLVWWGSRAHGGFGVIKQALGASRQCDGSSLGLAVSIEAVDL